MSTTVYIGMDVHSTNYTLSSYIFEEDKHFATVKLSPETNSILNYIKRIRKEYGDDVDVITGYEAGCLGYTLYKDLKKNKSLVGLRLQDLGSRAPCQNKRPVRSKPTKEMPGRSPRLWQQETIRRSMCLMTTTIR